MDKTKPSVRHPQREPQLQDSRVHCFAGPEQKERVPGIWQL